MAEIEHRFTHPTSSLTINFPGWKHNEWDSADDYNPETVHLCIKKECIFSILIMTYVIASAFAMC